MVVQDVAREDKKEAEKRERERILSSIEEDNQARKAKQHVPSSAAQGLQTHKPTEPANLAQHAT